MHARRRVRLPSMVDHTDRLARGCMVICAPSAPGCGTSSLAAMAETPLFSFPNPGFGRLPPDLVRVVSESLLSILLLLLLLLLSLRVLHEELMD